MQQRPYKVCLPICERFTIVQSENSHNMYHYDYKYCPSKFYSCPTDSVKNQFLVPENTELSNEENCVQYCGAYTTIETKTCMKQCPMKYYVEIADGYKYCMNGCD